MILGIKTGRASLIPKDNEGMDVGIQISDAKFLELIFERCFGLRVF